MSSWLSKIIGKSNSSLHDNQSRIPPEQYHRSVVKVGAVLLNEFEVERELGRGGMGTVYLVRSRTTARRYAVKEALMKDDSHRRAFFEELQTWIDLPDHPNILACRFFRTIGDEVLIFADYIEGGALSDWITQGKIVSLEQKLTIAIQFALGIHAIHEHELIHQDVKPANVLIDLDGTPKVADFGLTRARYRASIHAHSTAESKLNRETILASAGGMTPAYASPEQRSGQVISRKTDVWSWGVSVLDIFVGDVSCPYGGHIASQVLDSLSLDDQENDDIVKLPKPIVEILRKCFTLDPRNRWVNLNEAAEALMILFSASTGNDYSRKSACSSPPALSVIYDRQVENVQYRDARAWLRDAYEAVGLKITEADYFNPTPASSKKGEEVANLAIYNEAERIIEQVTESMSTELSRLLAKICTDKAILCSSLGDYSACLSSYDKCIGLYLNQMASDITGEASRNLALTYLHKANVVQQLGDFTESIKLYQQSLGIFKGLDSAGEHTLVTKDIALACMNLATANKSSGNIEDAVILYDESISIYEILVKNEPGCGLDDYLAAAYMNKANAIIHIGAVHEAVDLFEKSIKIREFLINEKGRLDLNPYLAQSYKNKASIVCQHGDYQKSIILYDLSIAIYEDLFIQKAKRQFGNDLAGVYMSKANVFSYSYCLDSRSDLSGRNIWINLFDCSISIREQIVENEGRIELASDLTYSYLNKAHALTSNKEYKEANILYNKCIGFLERLNAIKETSEISKHLANAYFYTWRNQRDLKEEIANLDILDKCIEIRKRLVEIDNGTFEKDLADVYMIKGNALKEKGFPQEAIKYYDLCIALRINSVAQSTDEEMKEGLAMVYINKAASLKICGEFSESIEMYDSGIAVFENLVKNGKISDLQHYLLWGKLSRAAVLLAIGKLPADEIAYARDAFSELLEEAGRGDSPKSIKLVEWSKNELGAILFDDELDYSLSTILPSGLKVHISMNSVVDLKSVERWYRCPKGDFWFWTPNLSITKSPISAKQEIVFDYLSAPVPKTREEAMEYVHVYVDDPIQGLYWRGDWMNSFHLTFALTDIDRNAWIDWVMERGNFLDAFITVASHQAEIAENEWDKLLEGEGMAGHCIVASGVPQRLFEERGHLYSLAEGISQHHRLPSSLEQRDYESAVNIVASDMRNRGVEVIACERDRNAPFSIIIENTSGQMAIKVTTVRSPQEPGFTDLVAHDLRKFSKANDMSCAIAPVGFATGPERSPDGHPGFYVKYGGLVSVP